MNIQGKTSVSIIVIVIIILLGVGFWYLQKNKENSEEPRLTWEYQLGAPMSYSIIKDGRIYAAAGTDRLVLDLLSGILLDTYKLVEEDEQGILNSAPIIAEGLLVEIIDGIPQKDGSVKSKVKIVELDSKEVVWERLVENFSAEGLLYDQGMVFVQTSSNLVNLDLKSGAILWEADVVSDSTPALDKELGLLYIHATDGNLYVVKVSDGSIQETVEIGSNYHGSPMIIKDEVNGIGPYIVAFGAVEGTVKTFNQDDLSVAWEFQVPYRSNARGAEYLIAGSSAYSQGRLFIPTVTNHLIALDVKNGEVLWVYTYPDNVNAVDNFWVGPSASSDFVILSTHDDSSPEAKNYILVFNAPDGDLLWKSPPLVGTTTSTSPILSNGYVIRAGFYDKIIRAYKIGDGELVNWLNFHGDEKNSGSVENAITSVHSLEK